MKTRNEMLSLTTRWILIATFVNLVIICSAQYAGGSGTEDDPYLIATPEHLEAVSQNLGSYFQQTRDINLDVPPYNEGEGWMPIGSNIDRQRFTGTYDGNGYVISGLFINRPDSEYPQGLFGFLRHGLVKNLGVIDVDVTGNEETGGMAGEGWDGNLKNCYAIGEVRGNSSVAVLQGRVRGCTIINCFASGSVHADDRYVGGLAGYFWNGTARNSYSTAAVHSNARYVGGLIGWNRSDGGDGIVNCYSTGLVPDGGGLSGSNSQGGIWSNSYWDVQTSGQANSPCGEGRNTLQMIYPEYLDDPDTYTDWDFESGEVWVHDETRTVNNGYPILHFQEMPVPDPPAVSAETVTIDNVKHIRLSWEAVEIANSYRIYASSCPESEDWGEPAAIVAETHYAEAIDEREKMFYRVVASTEEAP